MRSTDFTAVSSGRDSAAANRSLAAEGGMVLGIEISPASVFLSGTMETACLMDHNNSVNRFSGGAHEKDPAVSGWVFLTVRHSYDEWTPPRRIRM